VDRWTESADVTAAIPARATDTRDRTLDVAKGLAISAIVVSHVLRGLAGPDTLPRQSSTFLEIDDALYSFHVAVFALLAGMFLPAGVEKRGRLAYLRPRVILFTYLYVVWTVLEAGEKQLEAVVSGDPVDTAGFLQSFLTAYGQLWWLPFMVLASVAAVAVRPWASPSRAAASTAVVGLVALATWGWTGPWAFEEGLALLLFFWVGLLAGRERPARLTASRWTGWVAVLGLLLGAVLLLLTNPMPPSSWIGPRTTGGIALGVVTSSALCAAVLALAGLLSRTALVRPLALLGERSLELFLGHLLAITAARATLDALGVESLAAQLLAGTVAGLALPLGLWWAGRRAKLPWLFTSPLR
jgi:fucose 4-O-acetylase-like acetyltransferase